jgi:hypothetical protein
MIRKLNIFGVVAALYVTSYFFIFDYESSVVERGMVKNLSPSVFGPPCRVGDLSIYVHGKHWTNFAWWPIDIIVRRVTRGRRPEVLESP